MKIHNLPLIATICFVLLCFSAKAQNCNCSDYLYLNDTGSNTNYVEKFSINPVDGSLTEIGDSQNGQPWLNATNVVDGPHAIANDINGNLYIGENDQANGEYGIKKLNCVGQIIDANLSTPTIDNLTNDGFSFNHFIVDGILYANIFSDFETGTGDIVIYDLCTGNRVGCMREAYFWGFTEGIDGYWYGTGTASVGGFQNGIYRGLVDPAAYTNGAGGCGSFELVATEVDLGVPNGSRLMGVDQGPDGTLYGAVSAGGGFNPPSYILKFDTNGNVISQSLIDPQIENNSNDNLNWGGSRGVVYNNGFLYVSSGDDCIAVFDAATLTYQPALSINVQGEFPKQIGLVKECCPLNNTLRIDTTLCVNTINNIFFLQDFINCDGPVCEGTWQQDASNTGLTYNACDNSIALNEFGACGTFTYGSGSSGANAQCGTFRLELNIKLADGPRCINEFGEFTIEKRKP